MKYMKAASVSFKTIALALLLLAGTAAYANALGNEMFWDDDDNILKNAYVQDWSYIPQYFSENLIAGAGLVSNYWRPVLLSVWSLEWHLWSDWAPGYHAVNAGVHIAASYALFLVLLAVFQNRWAALFASLAFLLHPVQTEAVAYVSGLGDPLSVLFQMLGLLAYLRFRNGTGSFWKTGLFFALALMTKETAIIFPGLVALCEGALLLQERRVSWKEAGRRVWGAAWRPLAVAAGYIVLRATILNFQNTFNLYGEATPFTENLWMRVAAFFHILPSYARLLVWPAGLHMERAVEVPSSLLDASALGGAALTAVLLLAAFRCLRRVPAVSFGVAWFFLGLAPTSNILVPINGLMYEHWLYLPLAGLAFAAGAIAVRAARRLRAAALPLGLAGAVMLAGLAGGTITRNRDWRTPVSLYENILQYNKNSLRVWNNLGMAYADRGRSEEAKEAYRKAIALDGEGRSAPPRHNLGNLLAREGRLEEAAVWFERALEIDPRFHFSSNALAVLYVEQEAYGKAEEVLEAALKTSPESMILQRNLEVVRMLRERKQGEP